MTGLQGLPSEPAKQTRRREARQLQMRLSFQPSIGTCAAVGGYLNG